MAAVACCNCARSFPADSTGAAGTDAGLGTDAGARRWRRAEDLADLRGAEEPPQTAAWLDGAMPFDCEPGCDSWPIEFADQEPAEGPLCPECRAAGAGR